MLLMVFWAAPSNTRQHNPLRLYVKQHFCCLRSCLLHV